MFVYFAFSANFVIALLWAKSIRKPNHETQTNYTYTPWRVGSQR